jgi:hypothetical protein
MWTAWEAMRKVSEMKTNKGMGHVLAVALSLLVLTGAAVSDCSRNQGKLERPTLEVYQYQKGTTGEFDIATLDQMAESLGETNYRFGLAASIYPTYHYSTAARDAMARSTPSIGSPYRFGDNITPTTYAQLTAGDKMVVDGGIFAGMSSKEQDAVANAIAGFFDWVSNDMAAAKAPKDTSAFSILKQSSSEAAANNWADDVLAGKDCADRFFVYAVKQYVTLLPSAFEPFWLALGHPGVPSSPTDTEVEMVARMAGETNFTNGIASKMYPTNGEQKAQTMYGKTYAALSIMEAPYVDAAVYADLPSAFGTGAAVDAARATIRQTVTTNLKPLYGLSADNYTALKGTEKALVDQTIFMQLDAKDECGNYSKPLGFGPHLERDYIDFAAVPGAVLGWFAELTSEVPLTQNIAYLTLDSSVDTTSAIGWMQDVSAGASPEQAFYRWLAKEGVSEMSTAGTMIQVSVQEFYFKVDNPNDFDVSLDSLSLDFQVKAFTGENVDVSKQALNDKIWVPKGTEIILRVLAPVKTIDVISWVVIGGGDSASAQASASDVWNKIQDGQVEWRVVAQATVSNKSETQSETYDYDLQWGSS